uniref:Uncharacterized protein n=1 Tax=viral metagenome TaxID=1070528 RepID=A0A6M3JCC5_9ZZZZ
MNNEQFDKAILDILPEAAFYIKDTGCLKCDVLPGNAMCLDCQLEQADADVLQAMNRRAELERSK